MVEPRTYRPVVAVGLLSLVVGLGAVGAPAPALADGIPGCFSTSTRDINGDGFDDAVVGNPYATVSGRAEAGSVTILYGDADGRIGEGGRQVITQASVPGSAVEAGDHFGWSVALGHLDRSRGCVTLLVGSPGEDWSGESDAGIVHVIDFALDPDGGRPIPGAFVVDQADAGGAVEAGDGFGSTVVFGPDDEDVTDSMAAAAPGEDLGGAVDAGAVNVIAWAGATRIGADQIQQGRDGVPGAPGAGDRFGTALALGVAALPGDHEENPRILLQPAYAIGVPGDTVAGARAAGSVTLVGAARSSVTELRDVTDLTQDSPTIPGAVEAGDRFGAALAMGPSTAPVLVVGAPGESIGDVSGAGSVTVIDQTADGSRGRMAVSQDSAGVTGAAEPGDGFGSALAVRPGSPLTVAVGSPGEDLGSVRDAGYAHLLGVDGDPAVTRLYPTSATSLGSAARAGDHFGAVTAALHGVREDVLATSAPRSSGGTVVLDSLRRFATGPTRSWVAGRGGIPAVTRFGWSIG